MKIAELELNDFKKNDFPVTGAKPTTLPVKWKIQGFNVYIKYHNFKNSNGMVVMIFNKSKKIAQVMTLANNDPQWFWPISGQDITLSKVSKEYQGRGLGLEIYKLLILKIDINIYSSGSHSPGAVKLWDRLNQDPTIAVFLLDGEGKTAKRMPTSGVADRDYGNSSMSLVAVKTNSKDYRELEKLANA